MSRQKRPEAARGVSGADNARAGAGRDGEDTARAGRGSGTDTALVGRDGGIKPEVLAPVGGWEALLAAVENGADAVYLGGKQFSARQSADNFDREEMLRAVEYVHLRGAKLYVTVNTLLDDRELEAGLDYLRFLYEAGADAVILQDLGLTRLARRALPELELHASTQMTAHNAAGVEFLREQGFHRVVLSREVSLDNIRLIGRQSPAELEVFIHGALCVCYSGQCLMSSLIGGRSGNRGRCAQPCRLQYTLVDEKGQSLGDEGLGNHLLSPRDLNSIEFLPDLVRAGICSFKIEGRMKRPEYVATVTRVYREALDRCLANPENYQVTEEELHDLRQIFNRDFTPGYFFGNPGRDLMSYKRPNNRGLKLGRVSGYDPRQGTAELLLEDKLRVEDGLEVWVTQGGRQGLTVHRMTVAGKPVESAGPGEKAVLEVPVRMSVGDRVFKTLDAELMERARKSFEAPKHGRKIPLTVRVEARLGKPLEVVLIDSQGNRGNGQTAFLAEPARTRALTPEAVLKQVDRMGNTPWMVGNFEAVLDDNIMVPVSEINEARRMAVEKLEQARLVQYRRKPLGLEEWRRRVEASRAAEAPAVAGIRGAVGTDGVTGATGAVGMTGATGPLAANVLNTGIQTPAGAATALREPRQHRPLLAVSVSEFAALRSAVDAGANRVYFGGESFRHHEPITAAVIEKALAYCRENKAEFVLSTPRILQDEEMQAYLPGLQEILAQGPDGVLVSNLGLVKQLTDSPEHPRLFADFPLNIYNSQTIVGLGELGFSQVTLSPELTLEQITALGKTGTKISEADTFGTETSRAKMSETETSWPQTSGSQANAFGPDRECLVHGALPMMVSEYCPVGSILGGRSTEKACRATCPNRRFGLRDRMNYVFPIAMDRFCHLHIFNPKELCVIEELGTLQQTGITSFRLELKLNNPREVGRITAIYREESDRLHRLKSRWQPEERVTETLAALSPTGLTKGHYFRGVV